MDGIDASTDGSSSEASSADAMDELGDATSDAAVDAPDDGDAGADAFVADSGTLHCGGGFVSSCLACPGAQALCGDTCIANCHDNCPSAPIQCFACAAGNVPSFQQCTPTTDSGGCITLPNIRCTCAVSNDAGECPGPTQICNGGQCLACGEMNTDTQVCKLGTGQRKCDNGGGAMKLTCH